MGRSTVIAVLFLTPLLLLPLAGCDSGSHVSSTTLPAGANATVVRVIDGDTIDADFAGTTERVRLIGIDTPETKKPNTPVQCFGPEASAHTAELLAPDTPIRVERDAEARDDYGRLLGYVYRSSDGLFVNLDLAVGGYARPLTIEPNSTFADRFVDAARVAQAAGTGLWGSCSG
jgi:micrococcal nuclease